MLFAAEQILRRKIEINPYAKLFVETTSKTDTQLDPFNQLIGLALPYLNRGEPLDIEKQTQQVGVDIEMAPSVLRQIEAKMHK